MNALVEVKRLSDPSWNRRITNYVINRQNKDGGYTFCQGAESNGQDTYYGLTILSLLNANFPNIEKTVKFINDIRLGNIYSIYYVSKASLLLGKSIDAKLKKHALSTFNTQAYFGSTEFFAEVSSEFTTTFMALELADLLKIKVNKKEVAEWLLHFKNNDGGFGTQGQSNINSTYYATASMSLLNESLRDLRETLMFVRACEKPYGGFTVIPMSIEPYMEHTYYGVMTLDLLGEKSQYPTQTIDWILKCQNKNGGFARSDLGISTFEDTYYAITILQKLTPSKDLKL
ncbi:MAG: prenyltransferase/squalene oxidase repeat-containing protein [Candidatus Bathyarchaeia archaeon]|jgi:hypothetical protein